MEARKREPRAPKRLQVAENTERESRAKAQHREHRGRSTESTEKKAESRKKIGERKCQRLGAQACLGCYLVRRHSCYSSWLVMAHPDFRSAELEAGYSVSGKFRGPLFGTVHWTFASDAEPSRGLCAHNRDERVLLLRDCPSDLVLSRRTEGRRTLTQR